MKKKALSLLLASAMVLSMAACGSKDDPSTSSESSEGTESVSSESSGGSEETAESYTYRTYVAVSPSNWNQLTYKDNNDTEIMSYIGSDFFQYNFKFDDAGEIVPGDFVMEFGAATALEDISDKVDA